MCFNDGEKFDLDEMRTAGQKKVGAELSEIIYALMGKMATPLQGRLSMGPDQAQLAAMNTMYGVGGRAGYNPGKYPMYGFGGFPPFERPVAPPIDELRPDPVGPPPPPPKDTGTPVGPIDGGGPVDSETIAPGPPDTASVDPGNQGNQDVDPGKSIEPFSRPYRQRRPYSGPSFFDPYQSR